MLHAFLASRRPSLLLLASLWVACGDDQTGEGGSTSVQTGTGSGTGPSVTSSGSGTGTGGGNTGGAGGGSVSVPSICDVDPAEITLHVAADATGDGDGTSAAPLTLEQAAEAAAPGDVVLLAPGDYDVSSGLSFQTDATAEAPILWIGTVTTADFVAERADGTTSTVIRNVTDSSNGPISMSGDHNVFCRLVLQQDFGTPNGNDGRELVSISGDDITWEGVAFKHPTNASSSSNHSIRTNGDPDNLTFRGCHFYHGSRTIIWIQGNENDAPDNFLMEGCTLRGADHHPAIQIMPYTNLVSPVPIEGVVMRNNLFIDNGYGSVMHMRHNANFQFYNNVFVRSGVIFDLPAHPVAPFMMTGPGLIAHNTIVGDGEGYFIYDEATNDVTALNNLILNKGSFYSDLVSRFNCWNGGGVAAPIDGHVFDHNLFYVDTNPDFGEQRFLYPTSSACGSTSYLTMNDWIALGYDTSSLWGQGARPVFVDEAADDYRLADGSPGKEAGTPVAGVTVDFVGNPRSLTSPSIGAFE